MKRDYTITKEKDTRDNTDLFVIRFENRVSNFQALREAFKKESIYYSGFKKGFITKNEIDNNIIDNILDNVKVNKDNKASVKSDRIVYSKNLKDYITLDELVKRIEKHYSNYDVEIGRWHNFFTTKDEAIIVRRQEQIDYFKRLYNQENNIAYIREMIVLKSLNKEAKAMRGIGDVFRYELIWDKLPIIEGLELTKETYSAMWGYDQTNVDIAYRLNKKFNGLDIIYSPTMYEKVLLKRIGKDNSFNDGVRYFSRDDNPYETFKNDVSQTGYYR